MQFKLHSWNSRLSKQADCFYFYCPPIFLKELLMPSKLPNRNALYCQDLNRKLLQMKKSHRTTCFNCIIFIRNSQPNKNYKMCFFSCDCISSEYQMENLTSVCPQLSDLLTVIHASMHRANNNKTHTRACDTHHLKWCIWEV